MKTKKNEERLNLNKRTIAGLNVHHMGGVFGGTGYNQSGGKAPCCNLQALGDDDDDLVSKASKACVTVNNPQGCLN